MVWNSSNVFLDTAYLQLSEVYGPSVTGNVSVYGIWAQDELKLSLPPTELLVLVQTGKYSCYVGIQRLSYATYQKCRLWVHGSILEW